MSRRLTNFEFAQKRVQAERAAFKRALTDPNADPLDEQALVEMRRLLRSPLESEDDEPF
jgi:hypothetical protein